MRNLVNYASILVSITYSSKYLLLGSSKCLALEKLIDFVLLKKQIFKLIVHCLSNRSSLVKILYLKQFQFLLNLSIWKKHKSCQYVSKNQFLTLLEEDHLHKNIGSKTELLEHWRSVLQALRKSHPKKHITILEKKVKTLDELLFLVKAKTYCIAT